MAEFVLASASPRRRELMSIISEKFDVVVSEADESAISAENIPPSIYVQELALLKAASSAKKVLKNKKAVIIAADTIVVKDGKILGKPDGKDDAARMLGMLSGSEHEVYTGYCIMRIKDAKTVCGSVKTTVKFRELPEKTIERYIRTGEPMDKAGAYGIQAKGALLVERIDGDYFNVVGFPVSEIAERLRGEFDISVI